MQTKTLRGTVTVPASKSAGHRLLIAAALADCPTTLYCNELNDDLLATIDCLRALGAKIQIDGEKIEVRPLFPNAIGDEERILPCRQSGTTLRLMLPIAAALGAHATFTGEGRLPKRPLTPLCNALTAHGVKIAFAGEDTLPLTLTGRLKHGAYEIEANVSSQYLSGLLMALPLLAHSSMLNATTEVASRSYVDLTESVLQAFHVRVEGDQGKRAYRIDGNQTYRSPKEITVEGDWSQAAFWLIGGRCADGACVTVKGLSPESVQGDRALLKIFEQSCGAPDYADGAYTVVGRDTYAFCADCTDTPDLVPILAVLALHSEGNSLMFGISRLQSKESDRVQSVCEMITALGGEYKLSCDGDSLTVMGAGRLRGGKVKTYGDHRIAMAAAIASLFCDGEVEIDDPSAVEKSYPAFWQDFAALTEGK